MPQVRVSSDKWFIMVHGPLEFIRPRVKTMVGWIDMELFHAVYHEGAKKETPHFHAIVKLTSILQKQSFDTRIKKLFEIVKGSQYSTEVWDGGYGEGAGSYLYHESPDSEVLGSKGLTELHIAGFKEAAVLVARIVAKNKEKANTKLVTAALEHFAGQKAGNYEVFVWMMQRIRNGDNYHPGMFRLKGFVEEVVIKISSNEDFTRYVDTTFSSLFRN